MYVVSTTASAGNNTACLSRPGCGSASHLHYGTNGDIYWRSSSANGKVILQDTGGNVGIGTASPTAGRLVVSGGPSVGLGPYYYMNPTSSAFYNATATAAVSIWATARVVSAEFNAQSDQRIKNIKGRSDSRADLATIMGVEVTDYVHKDVVEKGSAPLKKLIAQQVEKAPQAVKQTTDSVPDIYQRAEIKDGWVELATDLKPGEHVKLITDAGSNVYDVLAVEPGRFRTTLETTSGKVFVFGREVKDFRVVDYDAISMLNVSATQEIKREKDAEVKALRDENSDLRARLAALEAKDRSRDAKLAAIEKLLVSPRTVVARPASLTNAGGQGVRIEQICHDSHE